MNVIDKAFYGPEVNRSPLDMQVRGSLAVSPYSSLLPIRYTLSFFHRHSTWQTPPDTQCSIYSDQRRLVNTCFSAPEVSQANYYTICVIPL
jgi:hypothetical protein